MDGIDLANRRASTAANAWGQAFGYDPWGNPTNVAVTQGSAPALSVSVNADNRVASFSYDAAGNMTAGNLPGTYTFDDQGHVTNESGSAITRNAYGWDVERVARTSVSEVRGFFCFRRTIKFEFSPRRAFAPDQ